MLPLDFRPEEYHATGPFKDGIALGLITPFLERIAGCRNLWSVVKKQFANRTSQSSPSPFFGTICLIIVKGWNPQGSLNNGYFNPQKKNGALLF